MPGAPLWFLDGKDAKGKAVANPNIGYGALQLKNKSGMGKDFYQIGLSANTTGISVYIGLALGEEADFIIIFICDQDLKFLE